MEKPENQKWWVAGKEYDNDIRKKLQAVGCGSLKRALIECRVEKKPEKECESFVKQFQQCENMLSYVVKFKLGEEKQKEMINNTS